MEGKMSSRLSNLSRRLAKIEREMAEKVRRKELANCICRDLTVAFASEEFEAEMNLPCPAHGLRRLGQIIAVEGVNPDKTVTEESTKLAQLLDMYELRLSQLPQSR
jgi:predicted component of type VI protein secretion system